MALDMERHGRSLPKALSDRLAGDPNALLFAGMLFGGVALDGLDEADIAALADDSRQTMAFLAEKPAARHKLQIRQSASGSRAIVEIVNDDMPFLLDSIMGEIQSRGLRVHLVAHPIVRALRSVAGRIKAIVGQDDPNWHDALQESLIVIYLDPLTPEQAKSLGAALGEILAEVRIAVADWRAMLNRVDRAIRDLELAPLTVPADLKAESIKLIRWMQDGHFTFLGLEDVAVVGTTEPSALQPVADSGLGLLRAPATPLLSRNGEDVSASAEVWRTFQAEAPVTISKASIVSRVHRRVPMDYIAIKTYARNARGSLVPSGELRIVGLFTSQAYTQTARLIPMLRHKIETVLQSSGYPASSHAGKALVNVLDTIPRDELFQLGVRDLAQWSSGILDLDLRPRVRLFARADRFARFTSVLLYAPRDRWTTSVREKITSELATAFGGKLIDFRPAYPEGPLVRLHLTFTRRESSGAMPDLAALEQRITDILRTWADRFNDGLAAAAVTPETARHFDTAFPAAYTDTIEPNRAIEDMRRIVRLAEEGQPAAIDFYRHDSDPLNRTRATIYRFGDPIRLSERVPILENLGFSAIDERSYRLTPDFPGGRRDVALHDMALESADRLPLEIKSHDQRLEDAFVAVMHGIADNDLFNRLITAASITWREALLLRAYAAYLRQLGTPFGMRYIAETLSRHATVARDLIELFTLRLDPDRTPAGEPSPDEIALRSRIDATLAKVPSLDEDRILRIYVNLIDATVRTNYFQPAASIEASSLIALKFDSKAVEAAPQPRPYREIWVYSPRVEGIHLRFAPIARGGIRWSDRAQDFRTEVLGLVKAQLVKNAVIVPSGAKGGFLPKQLPRGGSREDTQKEAIAAYRLFIDAILYITDNIASDRLIPPTRVVRRDGDDPYLVVAADKGTATFSDIANDISLEHSHWLGDAFASGGSAGYDHKRMAITARGGWECVKRHFREMDVDIQTTPFRVSGIGDMSGDVFGNGMLLSPEIRLLAAFDHRDIFIDPNPDAAASLAERQRLFDLPRSSWQDYDTSKISAGGGVFARSAKSIPLSPEMQQLFAIGAPTATPQDLMRAILKLPVDLLWLGGIGTYVRAAGETDEQVGDRSNDAIRVIAAECGAKVIGEGANLGLTQKARVELAGRGVRLNTDFIDNSAGVNSSDFEVNIKIALGSATRSGQLQPNARKAFLASMTTDVARGCLVNNYSQSLALSLMQRRAAEDTADYTRLMSELEKHKLFDRRLESLPSSQELAARRATGKSLTRPELAVLSSYTKLALTDLLLASAVPDQPNAAPLLTAYFPKRLTEEFAGDVATHRLRREIIATAITNAVVNRLGPANLVRLADEHGRTWPEVATAYLVAEQVGDFASLWKRLDALDNKIPGQFQLDLHIKAQRHLVTLISNLLADTRPNANADSSAATLSIAITGFRDRLSAGSLPASVTGEVESDVSALVAKSVPDDVARDLVLLGWLGDAYRIADIAAAAKADVANAAEVYFAIARALKLDTLKQRADGLTADDPFDRRALTDAHAKIAAAEVALAGQALSAGTNVETWLTANAPRLDRARSLIDRIATEGPGSVSRMTVAAAELTAAVHRPVWP